MLLSKTLHRVPGIGCEATQITRMKKSTFASICSITRLISSVRSSSVHHGLIEIQQQQQQGHFFRFFKIGAILPIYIHNSLSLSLSVQYTEQNQAILLHELHRMHVLSSRFYKVLQISLRPNICYIF